MRSGGDGTCPEPALAKVIGESGHVVSSISFDITVVAEAKVDEAQDVPTGADEQFLELLAEFFKASPERLDRVEQAAMQLVVVFERPKRGVPEEVPEAAVDIVEGGSIVAEYVDQRAHRGGGRVQ